MSQLVFDDDIANQLDTLYRTGDVLRRRRLVREASGGRPRRAGRAGIGCGPGFHVAELLEQVGATGSVVGVDASPQTLALARRRTRATTTSSCTTPCAPAAGWSSGTSTGRPCPGTRPIPAGCAACWPSGTATSPTRACREPSPQGCVRRGSATSRPRATPSPARSSPPTAMARRSFADPAVRRRPRRLLPQQPDQPWPTPSATPSTPAVTCSAAHWTRGTLNTRRATSFWLDAPSPWRSHRLDTGRALVDPAQDRLGTFQVIAPGHPLVPPRDPEVGQRADDHRPRLPAWRRMPPITCRTACRRAFSARQPRRNTSSRTSLTSGGRAASIFPAMAGMAPSHRVARRIGALFGQTPPTQIGTRGRCTGAAGRPRRRS